MSHEIEFKAHLSDNDSRLLIDSFSTNPNVVSLGEIDKKDIYWGTKDSTKALFRTRYEKSNGKEDVLITSKPQKSNDNLFECNEEVEFKVLPSEWDNIIRFCESLNLDICRLKYKTGYHFIYNLAGFNIHCEILNVKFLGWFLECEICIDSSDKKIEEKAKNALNKLMDTLNISKSSIEIKGYNKLLKEVGHEKG